MEWPGQAILKSHLVFSKPMCTQQYGPSRNSMCYLLQECIADQLKFVWGDVQGDIEGIPQNLSTLILKLDQHSLHVSTRHPGYMF